MSAATDRKCKNPLERVSLHLEGNERPLEVLRRAAASGSVPPVWLFTGPESVGKRTAAYGFARLLLCEHPDFEARPCNACRTCQRVLASAIRGGCRHLVSEVPSEQRKDREEDDEGEARRRSGDTETIGVLHPPPHRWCSDCQAAYAQVHPEVLELEVASDKTVIIIGQVRGLERVLRVEPSEGRYRIVIIPQAHRLYEASQQALLKTLEEPPSHTLFILCSPTHTAVLPTILSRSTLLRFSPLPIDGQARVATWLRDLPELAEGQAKFAQEHPDTDLFRTLDTLCEGSPGIALSLARDAMSGRRGRWFTRGKVLGVAAELSRLDGFDLIEKSEEIAGLAPSSGSSEKEGGELRRLQAEWIIDVLALWFRDLLMLTRGLADGERLLNQDHLVQLREAARDWTDEGALKALDFLLWRGEHDALQGNGPPQGYRQMIRANANLKTLLPVVFLRLKSFSRAFR